VPWLEYVFEKWLPNSDLVPELFASPLKVSHSSTAWVRDPPAAFSGPAQSPPFANCS
jgi:hypothetical protein